MHFGTYRGKSFIMLTALCLMTFSLTGCTQFTTADPEDGYVSESAMGALEYSLLVTKELSVVENELSSRFVMSDSIVKGSYEIDKEISNTDESILKLKEAQDVLVTTTPAPTYETDRQNAIDLIEDSILAMEGYKDALEAGNTVLVQSYAAEMRACFVAVSGEANHEYE